MQQQSETTRHTTTPTTQTTQTTSGADTWDKLNNYHKRNNVKQNKGNELMLCKNNRTNQTHNNVVEDSSPSKPCITNLPSRTKQLKTNKYNKMKRNTN